MHSRKLALVVAGAASALLLSGCTFSLAPQVPEVAGDDIATVVEDRLEQEVGTRPDVDCGDDAVKLEVGSKLTCVLTDPATGLEYDVVVSFTEVKGTEYKFDFDVADSPNNPPEPTAEPGATVTGDDIAALVVTALTPQLGAPPQVNCPEPTIVVEVDNTTYCTFDDETGTHDVEVTFTSFNPGTGEYSINAAIIGD